MKTFLIILILATTVCCFSFSLRHSTQYKQLYTSSPDAYGNDQEQLLQLIRSSDLSKENDLECPDTNRIIPELRLMLPAVKNIYTQFGGDFPATPLSKNYVDLYDKMIAFVNGQPGQFSLFDQFNLSVSM